MTLIIWQICLPHRRNECRRRWGIMLHWQGLFRHRSQTLISKQPLISSHRQSTTFWMANLQLETTIAVLLAAMVVIANWNAHNRNHFRKRIHLGEHFIIKKVISPIKLTSWISFASAIKRNCVVLSKKRESASMVINVNLLMVFMSYETCNVIRNIRQSYAELSIALASVHTERGKYIFIEVYCSGKTNCVWREIFRLQQCIDANLKVFLECLSCKIKFLLIL